MHAAERRTAGRTSEDGGDDNQEHRRATPAALATRTSTVPDEEGDRAEGHGREDGRAATLSRGSVHEVSSRPLAGSPTRRRT